MDFGQLGETPVFRDFQGYRSVFAGRGKCLTPIKIGSIGEKTGVSLRVALWESGANYFFGAIDSANPPPK